MSDVIEIGIIGGSGLYQMPELTDAKEFPIRTPFGATSDNLIKGKIAGIPVAFISRHARGHRLTPSEVPYAANIFALKSLGVKYIIGVSACGSLREDYAPGSICVPDQLVDQTHGIRRSTFFGEGLVAHVGVADPFSPEMVDILAASAQSVGGTTHKGGTFVTVEGPRFSTRAESETYRKLGYSIIGMTTTPEAFLALEAEIAYAVFAHITDYDVWHATEADVSVAAVIETLHQNLRFAQQAVVEAVKRIAQIKDPLPAHSALAHAFITDRKSVPPPILEKLRPIIGKYFPR
jgi:5'-methylthioadenosine phosphorylase